MIARPVYLKAIVGALLALATWGGTALADDHVTGTEWFGLLGAVVTGGLVYVAKNGADINPTTSTPQHDRGSLSSDWLVGVAVVLAVIVVLVVLV